MRAGEGILPQGDGFYTLKGLFFEGSLSLAKAPPSLRAPSLHVLPAAGGVCEGEWVSGDAGVDLSWTEPPVGLPVSSAPLRGQFPEERLCLH